MEERQKTRLIILAISGLLFGAGGFAYYTYLENKKAAELEDLPPVVSVRLPVREKPVNTATTTPVGTAADGTGPVKPAVAFTTPGATTPAATTGATTTPAVNVVTNTAATTGESPVKPVVAVTPPVVPVPVRPVPVTAKPVTTTPVATQPNATPVASTVRPTAQPVAQPVAQTPVVTPKPQITSTPSTVTSPAQTVTGLAQPAQTPGATPVASGDQSLLIAPPDPKKQYLSTPAKVAAEAAKQGAGREDPVSPIASFLPWPRARQGDANSMLAMVPPPPPTADAAAPKKSSPKKIDEKLVPPPPPVQMAAGPDAIGGLPIDQLPVPPSRPTISDKLKVLGVLDDKALVAFPRAMAIKNKWPKTLMLGPGEQFESFKIVSISQDGITIEEDGERILKPITAIK